MSPGLPEILIIFFIIVLLFGAKKLPELAKGLGKGLREFKQATKEPEIEGKKSEIESSQKTKEQSS
ncbi:MAG: twin-arginine translocase TatA/TatE family subunit [bacterium]